MKIVRHALFIVVVVFTADAAANDGAETRAIYNAASVSNLIAKAKLAGHHFRQDIGRLVDEVAAL